MLKNIISYSVLSYWIAYILYSFGDLMEMIAHLVFMDPKDHLDLQGYEEKKEEADLKDN